MAKEEKAGKKKSKLKIVLIAVAVIIVIAAVGGMGSGSKASSSSSSDGEQTTQTDEQKAVEQEPYTIADEQADGSNQFMLKITGTLTNNTDQDKSYIQVEYNLYDADGAQVGTALANTNNLKAGGTWKFEAVSTTEPDKVATWERMDVTGF